MMKGPCGGSVLELSSSQRTPGKALGHSDLPQQRLCGHQEQSKVDGSTVSSILVPELGRTGKCRLPSALEVPCSPACA